MKKIILMLLLCSFCLIIPISSVHGAEPSEELQDIMNQEGKAPNGNSIHNFVWDEGGFLDKADIVNTIGNFSLMTTVFIMTQSLWFLELAINPTPLFMQDTGASFISIMQLFFKVAMVLKSIIFAFMPFYMAIFIVVDFTKGEYRKMLNRFLQIIIAVLLLFTYEKLLNNEEDLRAIVNGTQNISYIILASTMGSMDEDNLSFEDSVVENYNVAFNTTFDSISEEIFRDTIELPWELGQYGHSNMKLKETLELDDDSYKKVDKTEDVKDIIESKAKHDKLEVTGNTKWRDVLTYYAKGSKVRNKLVKELDPDNFEHGFSGGNRFIVGITMAVASIPIALFWVISSIYLIITYFLIMIGIPLGAFAIVALLLPINNSVRVVKGWLGFMAGAFLAKYSVVFIAGILVGSISLINDMLTNATGGSADQLDSYSLILLMINALVYAFLIFILWKLRKTLSPQLFMNFAMESAFSGMRGYKSINQDPLYRFEKFYRNRFMSKSDVSSDDKSSGKDSSGTTNKRIDTEAQSLNNSNSFNNPLYENINESNNSITNDLEPEILSGTIIDNPLDDKNKATNKLPFSKRLVGLDNGKLALASYNVGGMNSLKNGKLNKLSNSNLNEKYKVSNNTNGFKNLKSINNNQNKLGELGYKNKGLATLLKNPNTKFKLLKSNSLIKDGKYKMQMHEQKDGTRFAKITQVGQHNRVNNVEKDANLKGLKSISTPKIISSKDPDAVFNFSGQRFKEIELNRAKSAKASYLKMQRGNVARGLVDGAKAYKINQEKMREKPRLEYNREKINKNKLKLAKGTDSSFNKMNVNGNGAPLISGIRKINEEDFKLKRNLLQRKTIPEKNKYKLAKGTSVMNNKDNRRPVINGVKKVFNEDLTKDALTAIKNTNSVPTSNIKTLALVKGLQYGSSLYQHMNNKEGNKLAIKGVRKITTSNSNGNNIADKQSVMSVDTESTTNRLKDINREEDTKMIEQPKNIDFLKNRGWGDKLEKLKLQQPESREVQNSQTQQRIDTEAQVSQVQAEEKRFEAHNQQLDGTQVQTVEQKEEQKVQNQHRLDTEAQGALETKSEAHNKQRLEVDAQTVQVQQDEEREVHKVQSQQRIEPEVQTVQVQQTEEQEVQSVETQQRIEPEAHTVQVQQAEEQEVQRVETQQRIEPEAHTVQVQQAEEREIQKVETQQRIESQAPTVQVPPTEEQEVQRLETQQHVQNENEVVQVQQAKEQGLQKVVDYQKMEQDNQIVSDYQSDIVMKSDSGVNKKDSIITSNMSPKSNFNKIVSNTVEIDERLLLDKAVQVILAKGKASQNLLRKELKVDANIAKSIIETLQADGVIGKREGTKGHPVLIGKEHNHMYQLSDESKNTVKKEAPKLLGKNSIPQFEPKKEVPKLFKKEKNPKEEIKKLDFDL